MRNHYTTAQRAELTSLVVSGQATPRAAAGRLGVPASTAYYWLRTAGRRATAITLTHRTVRPSAAAGRPPAGDTPPPFARLVRAADGASPLTLRIGAIALEVRPGFDAGLLREVVAALTEAVS
jgi:transposase-like protein